MISTIPSDEIHDFLVFLSQTVGPEALRERAGASPGDIQGFVELARRPLPPLYLGYLREFGQQDRVLKMADDANPQVTALIQLYEEQAGRPDPEIPPDCVIIGVQGLSGGRALFYAAEAAAGGSPPARLEEPSVVVTWWEDVGHTYARTFRNHLYRQAFVRGRFRDGALASLYRPDEDLFPHARQLAATLGFQAYWFSDDYQDCRERDDGAVLYLVRSPNRTTLYVRAGEEHIRDQLKATLLQQLDLRDSTPS
jgi:hypothetical protein